MFDNQVTVAYNKDPSPVKLNLGVGAYRTEVSFSIKLLIIFEHLCNSRLYGGFYMEAFNSEMCVWLRMGGRVCSTARLCVAIFVFVTVKNERFMASANSKCNF